MDCLKRCKKEIREYAPSETSDVIELKGKGACPPEDCGGVWGCEDLLRIHAKKRRSKEDKERLQWYICTIVNSIRKYVTLNALKILSLDFGMN